MSDHPLSRALQVSAATVLVLTLLAAMVLALGPGRVPEQMIAKGVPVALCVAGGVGFSAILLALMGLLERGTQDTQTQKLLSEIRDQLSRVSTSLPPAATGSAMGSASAMPGTDGGRIVQLLDEIREIALLDEQQKRVYLQRLLTTRRQAAATTVEALAQQQRWTEARATLRQAQTVLGDGPELQLCEQRLLQAIAAAETQAFAETQKNIAAHQAAEKWDEAIAEGQRFLEKFPDSAPGVELHANLLAARDNWMDTTANRLFEQVKLEIEQRSWRKALVTAQQLLTRCPNHLRAKQLESQMQIIRENADIEQRNAMESRIHELVKAQQLQEAITVAEDLIKAYPLSPQAQIASQLAVRLRERLEEQQAQPV